MALLTGQTIYFKLIIIIKLIKKKKVIKKTLTKGKGTRIFDKLKIAFLCKKIIYALNINRKNIVIKKNKRNILCLNTKYINAYKCKKPTIFHF